MRLLHLMSDERYLFIFVLTVQLTCDNFIFVQKESKITHLQILKIK